MRMNVEGLAARNIEWAMNEARDAYNAAKRDGADVADLPPRALWVLIVGAAHGFGVPIHDAQTGEMLHDPAEPREETSE